jgi:hypothetical protein
MLMVPMSDVPAAAAWAVSFWCVLAGTIGFAMAGGAAAALAVLIRPNLAPLAGFALLWFVFEARAAGPDRRRYLLQALGFFMALLPGFLITAALNLFWNGSALRSGYGTVTDIFSFGNMLPNLKHYATWLSQTQTPLAFLGIVALLVPAKWLWPSGVRRSFVLVLGLFVVAVWVEYCAYLTFGAWWDLRFLLPSWGFMMIGVAVVLLRVIAIALTTPPLRDNRLLVSLVLALVVIGLGVRGVRFARTGGVFDQQRWETKYPAAATIVAARTDPNAVIFSGLHSGSLRYYAGRTTLNYYNLDRAWLEQATAWLSLHGAHPYALLEEQEVKDFQSRFWAEGDARRLAVKPAVFYDGPAKIYFFDLARPPASTVAMETIIDPFPEVRAVSPAKPPVLVFK